MNKFVKSWMVALLVVSGVNRALAVHVAIISNVTFRSVSASSSRRGGSSSSSGDYAMGFCLVCPQPY